MSTNSSPITLLTETLRGWEHQQPGVFVGQPVPLGRPLSFEHYKSWVESHRSAGLEYLKTSLSLKGSPQDTFPGMVSIIPVACNYLPHPVRRPPPGSQPLLDRARSSDPPPSFTHLRTAHYSKGEDYHHWFREQLISLAHRLEQEFPQEQFTGFTDSVPIMERDFAYQGGLGWVGKNTCLIHPKRGSFFFIGEILTSLPVPASQDLMRNFCGQCNACVEACPTEALSDQGLDASRCISYWNIESKTVAPPEIRSKMTDWFFGCDICQTVCPWNIKWHGKKEKFQNTSSTDKAPLVEELRWVLTHSNRDLQRAFQGTALLRAGGRGLKRNALTVAGNLKLKELQEEVKAFLDHPRLGELAQWAMDSMEP